MKGQPVQVLQGMLVSLVAVGLAELGDKTQLIVLLLASRTKKHLQLLAGVVLGFLVVDGVAVLAGGWVARFVPAAVLKVISGAVFVVFGLLTLFVGERGLKIRPTLKTPLFLGFVSIFFSEWGDKTQIASALFATRYDGLLVLAGVMLALTTLSLAAIYLGKAISERVREEVLRKVAGAAFILVGAWFFFV